MSGEGGGVARNLLRGEERYLYICWLKYLSSIFNMQAHWFFSSFQSREFASPTMSPSRDMALSSPERHQQQPLTGQGIIGNPPASASGVASAEGVLAELDNVLSYHSNVNPNSTTPQQSSSEKKSGSSKKKRSSKDHNSSSSHHYHHRDSNSSSGGSGFKLTSGGGTWPRTRGGPVIEQGTGTILHPQKMKKERLPLAELLNNLPKYPPEKPSSTDQETAASNKIVYRDRDNNLNRSARESSRRTRPLTTYDFLPNSGNSGGTYERSRKKREDHSSGSYDHRYATIDNNNPVSSKGQQQQQQQQQQYASVFTPSDTSIDESVKSGHAEKEFLERYLKKTSSTSSKQPNSGSQQQQPSTSMAKSPPPSELIMSPHLSSPPGPMTLSSGSQSAYAALKAVHDIKADQTSPATLIRPNASGFSPYFPASIHTSSPRYSSPHPVDPTLSSTIRNQSSGGGGDLGSPIPDYRLGSSDLRSGTFEPLGHHNIPNIGGGNSSSHHHHSQHSASSISPSYFPPHLLSTGGGSSVHPPPSSHSHAHSHSPSEPHYNLPPSAKYSASGLPYSGRAGSSGPYGMTYTGGAPNYPMLNQPSSSSYMPSGINSQVRP